ncbi:MAG: hypothetical protein OEN01_01545 [Candidatus Krumholzibacteria bacterium]|nr:hypothetical protein [Candidatus Krumholzibacteria bacterium]
MKACLIFGGLLVLGTAIVLGIGVSDVAAYAEYAQGCHNCHGGFRTNNYSSLADGQAWGGSMHSSHQDWLGGDCDGCHSGSGKSPVILDVSDGGSGLAAISCLGCHGRDEGGAGVTGAGLRQHHWSNFITSCGNTGCHADDSNPSVFTVVGEHVLPPYYANPGTGHPDIPDHPCNLLSQGYPEDVAAAALSGLDNDGDGVYDTGDLDCAGVVPIETSTWGGIKAMFD